MCFRGLIVYVLTVLVFSGGKPEHVEFENLLKKKIFFKRFPSRQLQNSFAGFEGQVYRTFLWYLNRVKLSLT